VPMDSRKTATHDFGGSLYCDGGVNGSRNYVNIYSGNKIEYVFWGYRVSRIIACSDPRIDLYLNGA